MIMLNKIDRLRGPASSSLPVKRSIKIFHPLDNLFHITISLRSCSKFLHLLQTVSYLVRVSEVGLDKSGRLSILDFVQRFASNFLPAKKQKQENQK